MSEERKPALRVLHCPEMVAGIPQILARAERALGTKSWAVSFRAPSFHYACDEVLWSGADGRIVQEFKRWRFLWRAIRRFDVIHFNFGQTIFPAAFFPEPHAPGQWKHRLRNCLVGATEQMDLPLLKRLGKTIAVTFQGDDARQGDVLSSYAEWRLADELSPDYYVPAADQHKRRRIARFARWADIIYAVNPDLLRVLPPQASFLPYAQLDPREWSVVEHPARDVPLVLHAPTHRGIKGTRHVLEAVHRLQSEAVPFQFELVEGLTHAQAMDRYRQADLVVDQLLLGWYGGLAVEVMALGKPVIAHVRESDLRFIPAEMRDEMPIIRALPGTVYDVMKEWLTRRRGQLPDQGRRCRRYVERWHDPMKIAQRTIADYAGTAGPRRTADGE